MTEIALVDISYTPDPFWCAIIGLVMVGMVGWTLRRNNKP